MVPLTSLNATFRREFESKVGLRYVTDSDESDSDDEPSEVDRDLSELRARGKVSNIRGAFRKHLERVVLGGAASGREPAAPPRVQPQRAPPPRKGRNPRKGEGASAPPAPPPAPAAPPPVAHAPQAPPPPARVRHAPPIVTTWRTKRAETESRSREVARAADERSGELEQLDRKRRVADVLNSEFRTRLEELLKLQCEIHAELILRRQLDRDRGEERGSWLPFAREGEGEGDGGGGGGGEGAGAGAGEPPPEEPPSAAADAASGAAPPNGASRADAEVLSRVGTLQSEVGRLSASWEKHASESAAMTQLLASSFSLTLSLQEQQARTASALCELAQRIEERGLATPKPAAPAPAPHADAAAPADLGEISRLVARLSSDVATAQSSMCEQLAKLESRLGDGLRARPSRAAKAGGRLGRRAARGVGEGIAVARAARGGGGGGAAARKRRARKLGVRPSATGAVEGREATAEPTERAARAADADCGPPASQAGVAEPAPAHSSDAAPPQSKMCVVCESRETEAVLYRCGHKALCMCCAHYLRHERLPCPVCRAPIDDVVRCYA